MRMQKARRDLVGRAHIGSIHKSANYFTAVSFSGSEGRSLIGHAAEMSGWTAA